MRPETTIIHYDKFYLLLATGVDGSAHVKRVVQRDLVVIADNLVQGSVVQGCGHVTKEAGHTLTGVQDVSVGSEHNNETVNRLEHQMSELLVGKELRFPISLNLFCLKIFLKLVFELQNFTTFNYFVICLHPHNSIHRFLHVGTQ